MNTERRLYQWDTGQKLVGCTGLYVDFPIDNEVYRVETADGTCIIPDELLQTSGSHKVYECMTNNTIRSFAFSVAPRPKPPDYVYTPTERLTFEGLVQKVDDAVADMIRRAESGEFDGYTPVKGKDYFTASEIQQIQNEVSSGAIGEFKTVVDSETETFNNNAESKLTAYNQNDSQKTTAYNTNATKKLNAYNSNANNKLAEFDAHTEQIQTDISGLKSDLVDVKSLTTIDKHIGTEIKNITDIVTVTDSKYMSLTGIIQDNTALSITNKIDVVEGDILFSEGGAENPYFRFVTAFNGDTAVAEKGVEFKKTYTVPDGIDGVVITFYTTDKSNIGTITHKVYAVENIYKDTIDTITIKSANLFNDNDDGNEYGYYMSESGTKTSSEFYNVSHFIPVEAGETYYFHYDTVDGDRNFARFVTAYAGDTVVESAGAGTSITSVTSWTCPEGITQIRVTYYNETYCTGFMVSTINTSKYVPYGVNLNPDAFEYFKFKKAVTDIINDSGVNPYMSATAESMNDGGTLSVGSNHVKNNKHLVFSANITTFGDGIVIGHGGVLENDYNASYISIMPTNVAVYERTASPIVIGTYQHGLTIANDIEVTIDNYSDINAKAKIRIVSQGNSFEQEVNGWQGSNGAIAVNSYGTTMTDCKLSWTTDGYKKDIQMYGDSYFGMRSVDRWAYYLAKDGYAEHILMDGYAGRASNTAITSLTDNLKHSKPKFIIWCMGMNDGSDTSETEPSWQWYYNRDKVISLCGEDIEPIFATIPTVPTINHEGKNNWIRNSGYRYIDFAKAVGADADGNWYDGMLSSDGVHPTEKGAKALYMRALLDVPELMIN